ncbi:hypothetical protein AGABI2DRAFT_150577 [Agaricus bisporus var. bisporus H97]|uniref:hypothetical protein n=1 Tax=Agaricus bisporus var. bisporus (strain H97 / ATCC MYA-4626 / FGSC 10389) TaxID=936046 RepID=UPI00029F5EBB|nr:hypothetical protein AGABI2DRAFT_150577 [Agaricus bisporus var. bisporus H97]EKV47087.1 hypothetical protein AGABI2DRAFT_150577 [Agaricus bisporus var. bisporus H97]
MPSALAGQSITNPTLSSPPIPETRTGAPDTPVRRKNPQIAELKAIFPDYDEAILQSVLESCDGNQDRAIDLLLGMSDPNFKPAAENQVQQRTMTQEELDEQLARRLMLEEQEQAQELWQQQQQQQQQQRRPQLQTRQQQQQQQQQPNAAGGNDTLSEVQEHFNRIAASGKKTFGAFMEKVKAKIQEFDKPESDASGSGVQPTWGNTNSTTPHDSNAATRSPPPRTDYQPYRGGHATGGDYNTSTAMPQPAAYYDPNHSPQPQSAPLQFPSPNVDAKKSTQPTAVEGYDVTPIASQPIAAPSSAAQSSSATVAASPPPRGPSPGNPIDGGKLGLLPKRPISLVRDQPQTQNQHAQRHNTDDDDLEYAESPFDK